MIEFVVDAAPVAQPRQRVGVVAGRARAYLPQSDPVWLYKELVALAARDAYTGPLLEGPLRVDTLFVLERPRGKVWKRKAMPRLPHASRPDLDNLVKAVLDALSGVLWRDDAQVCCGEGAKVVAAGGEWPHVVVSVRAAALGPDGLYG